MVGDVNGKIHFFPKKNPTKKSIGLFLDIKRQLYSFSFHPKYEENGQIFIFSPSGPQPKKGKKMSRVSRYVAKGKPGKRIIDPKSEKIIIEWVAGGHNGGEAIIGPDGYLYICTGDGTSGSDINNTGQGVNDLHAVMLRVDVDNPDPGKPYSIPKDNPFVNYPGARPEIWAHGFRNPWRMSFDEKTKQLLVGDVGQDIWEMIWLVKKGGNYGWSVQEGSHPFHPEKKAGPGPIQPPLAEHHHTDCRSITGGYVYYGNRLPELKGVYIYGDYQYGKIWGLRYKGNKAIWTRELANTPLMISTFGVGRDGEFWALDYSSGEIYELVKNKAASANLKFPRKLSQTGLFKSTPKQQPAAGVYPYEVNAPGWTDGGKKQRYFALPGSKTASNAGKWSFPDGSVAAETISLEMETGNPKSRRYVETRVLIKQENHWLGYSYLWNKEQTDAMLVEGKGRDVILNIKDQDSPGGNRKQKWHVPARNECMVCHSRAAGFTLGLANIQLNRNRKFKHAVDNQLRTWNHIGLFNKKIKVPKATPAYTNPYDPKANLSKRARTYLHINCSVCHVNDGGGNAKFQVRMRDTKNIKTLLKEKPLHGNFGLVDAMVVKAGDPYSSVMLYRLSKWGRGRMPHVGSEFTDDAGLNLIHDWINSLRENKDIGKQFMRADYKLVVHRLISSMGKPAQQKWINAELQTTRSAFMLARALAREPKLKPIRLAVARRAKQHPDANVRDLFERFLPLDERTKRLGNIVNAKSILRIKGNAARGRSVFFAAAAAQCRNCHKIKDKGANLGPDLSTIGKKYKRHEILESILFPSKKIDPKFVTAVVLTGEGNVLTGIIVKRDKKELVLRSMVKGKAENRRLSMDDVEQITPQKTSLMPEKLLRDMTAQQAADLVEYLFSLK